MPWNEISVLAIPNMDREASVEPMICNLQTADEIFLENERKSRNNIAFCD
jgi:hypothetical protein